MGGWFGGYGLHARERHQSEGLTFQQILVTGLPKSPGSRRPEQSPCWSRGLLAFDLDIYSPMNSTISDAAQFVVMLAARVRATTLLEKDQLRV
jgi:hypothetical protein